MYSTVDLVFGYIFMLKNFIAADFVAREHNQQKMEKLTRKTWNNDDWNDKKKRGTEKKVPA